MPGRSSNTAFDHTILRPGRNCWKIATANKAAILIDAAAYFAAVETAIRSAKRSILIVGWDFDSRIKLSPQNPDSPTLGALLRNCVEQNENLQIDILVWSIAVVHAPSAPMSLLFGENWEHHPRIRLRLDAQHPIYAAHHQKIVCVDGSIAFSGGIDLTVQRWDDQHHAPDNPLRRDPAGQPYIPVHDVQMVVDGDAALALCEVVRERWRRMGLDIDIAAHLVDDLWPDHVIPDFTNIPVGISRTMPPWAEFPPAEEIWSLTDDAIRAARTLIYIEAQYLTANRLAKLLSKRLQESDGPDIVIVVTKEARGLMEQFIMGRNRERFMRRIQRADRFGRLKIYYPTYADGSADQPIHVHAKLMIVDDVFVRVGSANLNNRSMGLDTECDLVVEGHNEPLRQAVCRIRERLLAEHLGVKPDDIRLAAQTAKSTIRGIEELNRHSRHLRELPSVRRFGPIGPAFGTFILDPVRPFEPAWSLKRKNHSKIGAWLRSLFPKQNLRQTEQGQTDR